MCGVASRCHLPRRTIHNVYVEAYKRENFHHLLSILLPQSSYPLMTMARSNLGHRPVSVRPVSEIEAANLRPHRLSEMLVRATHDCYDDYAHQCVQNKEKMASNCIRDGFAKSEWRPTWPSLKVAAKHRTVLLERMYRTYFMTGKIESLASIIYL